MALEAILSWFKVSEPSWNGAEATLSERTRFAKTPTSLVHLKAMLALPEVGPESSTSSTSPLSLVHDLLLPLAWIPDQPAPVLPLSICNTFSHRSL